MSSSHFSVVEFFILAVADKPGFFWTSGSECDQSSFRRRISLGKLHAGADTNTAIFTSNNYTQAKGLGACG